MRRITPLIIIAGIVVSFLGSGCISRNHEIRHREFVILYAQTLIFFEREKMGNKISDSLYQVQLKDFFASHQTTEAEFKKRTNKLMKDEVTWKLFLQQVSASVDSIKYRSGR